MGWGYKVIFRKKKKKGWKRSFALDRFSKTPAYIPHAQFLLTVSVRSATAHHLLFKGSSWSSHRIKACGSSCYLISRKTTNQPTNSNSAANMNAKVSNSSLMDDRYDLLDLDDQSLPGISTDSVSEDRKYIVSRNKRKKIYIILIFQILRGARRSVTNFSNSKSNINFEENLADRKESFMRVAASESLRN